MKHSLVLMTALPPTTGHRDLIDFAAHLPDTHVWVLICARSSEPYTGEQRLAAVSAAFADEARVTVRLLNEDEAPQNPPDHENFWAWWKDTVNISFPETSGEWSYVVASEFYGREMADALDARFMPFDQARTGNPARGTSVRSDLWDHWDSLLPRVRQDFQVRVAMFGPESVGKTSVARRAAQILAAQWTPEYARPYLEIVGPTCDLRAMAEIHAGQSSLQRIAYEQALTPALVMDTDLFTTAGYYPLMNEAIPQQVLQDAKELAPQRYYLLSDAAPFEHDTIRYGGHQRESDTLYWESVLIRNNLPYVSVPVGSVEEEAQFVAKDVKNLFYSLAAGLANFVRD